MQSGIPLIVQTPPQCPAYSPVHAGTRTRTRTHKHTHTVDTYAYQSFCLHNAPLPSSRRSLAAFPGQPASSAQGSIKMKMTSQNIFPWPRPSPVNVIYVNLPQHAHRETQKKDTRKRAAVTRQAK